VEVDDAAPFFFEVAVAVPLRGPTGVLIFVVDVATAEAKLGT
jgi:hypothetical protein